MLYTRCQVAELLNVSIRTVSNLKRRGQLRPTCFIGKRPRFSADAVQAFMESSKGQTINEDQ